MPSAAAQDVLQAILEQRAAEKRREMAAPPAGPPAALPFARHAADPASLPFADRWHNSLANRILSAPSKLFGGLVADPAMDLATLAGDVIHGRQPTMAADPQTGEFHTDPRLINRTNNAAGMLTLGAGAIPAEANSLRMGMKVFRVVPEDVTPFEAFRPRSNKSGVYAFSTEKAAKEFQKASGGKVVSANIGDFGKPEFLDDFSIEGHPAGKTPVAMNSGDSELYPRGEQLYIRDTNLVDPTTAQDIEMLPRPGIRAYHGSPHDFERFDSSKIGTGEGAQAYGSGLYFAENEAVAKEYRDNLSQVPTHVLVDGESVGKYGEFGRDPLANAAAKVLHSMGDRGGSPTAENIKDAIEQFRSLNERSGMYSADDADAIEQAMQSLEGRYVDNQTKAAGKMYQVDIAADPEHFLDWDKPLSEQSPQVREILKQRNGPFLDAGDLGANWRSPASQFYKFRSDVPNSPKVASEKLRDYGIPGIKYLDQGSRGKPQWTVDGEPLNWVDASVLNDYRVKGAASLEKAIGEARDAGRDAHVTFLEGLRGKKLDDGGTRNYVVFDDKLISILKKYGLPISAAGLAALSQLHPQEAQAAQKQRQ